MNTAGGEQHSDREKDGNNRTQEVGDDERKAERQSQGREKNQDQSEGGKRD